MHRISSKFLFLLLPLTAACAPDIASQEWATNGDGGTQGCPAWQCGNNGPDVNGMKVGEFNVAGEESPDGYRILAVTDWIGLPLSLTVENGMFVGKPLLGSKRTGSAMEGARIYLEDLSTLAVYAIVIDDFGYVPSWTTPSFPVPAYHLWGVDVDLSTLNILPPYAQVCESTVVAQGLGLFSEHYAVLVNGERYDPYTKTVSATGAAATDWFNIACNGSALSKMKLMGYDPEFTDNGTTQATTTDQRAATLKMITAAYCPSGMSFTQSGQPLRWDNRDGTVAPDPGLPAEDTPEAIWTGAGALCLDVARLEAENPGIVDEIEAECGAPLPSCAAIETEWQVHGEWRTANPMVTP